MTSRFKLQYEKDAPVGYIDLVEGRKNSDAKQEVVIDIEDLPFYIQELIFDLDENDNVIGVELLG